MPHSNLSSGQTAADSAPEVAVSYFYGEMPLEGTDDFLAALKQEYSDVSVKGERAGLGGGLYTLFVEVVATVTLPHVLQLILDGVAFDLIKLSARNLVLRPLLVGISKLKERNKSIPGAGDLAYVRLIFSDSIITLDADSRVDQDISKSVGTVLRLVAGNYNRLLLRGQLTPAEIYIPIIEDTSSDRRSRFRAVLEVDEDMPINNEVFCEYWGLSYGDGSRRVFDVKRQLLIDEYFLHRQEYWTQMEVLWKERRNLA